MIIGIGGLSRSGKSFLAEELKKLFVSRGKSVTVLDQEDFVLPSKEIPLIRDHVDWEIPESIDWQKLKTTISLDKKNSDVLIIEGLMVFWDEWIRGKCDKRIFIEFDKKEFVSRKRIDLRWGKEPEWYIEHIWQSYLQYGHSAHGENIDITLNGSADFDIPSIFLTISEGIPG